MLNFWAQWWGPCIHELPQLKSLYEKYKDREDFVLVGLSQDGDRETVAEFVKKNKMPWIQALDGDGFQTGVANKYRVSDIPHYVFIDRNGLVRDRNLRDFALIDNLISSLLAEEVDDASKKRVAKLHQLRGNVYSQRGEEDNALAEYEEALRIQPENRIEFYMRVAYMYEKRGEIDKALELFDKTFARIPALAESEGKHNPAIPHTAYELAEKYSKYGDREKCLVAFKIAVEGDPKLKKRAKDSAGLFTAIRDIDEFQQLIADAPENPELDEVNRKMSELWGRLHEMEKSFVVIEADGTVVAGAVLDQSGYILADAEVTKHPDIRVIFGRHNVKAQVIAKEEELQFAILKIGGGGDSGAIYKRFSRQRTENRAIRLSAICKIGGLPSLRIVLFNTCSKSRTDRAKEI